MRKCVSMVAAASAAFGLAACSAPDRESAGAAQPLSARAGGSAAGGAHGAPVAVAAAEAAAPAVPAASGAGSAKLGSRPGSQPALRAAAAAPAIGVPVLVPSGTTDVAPQAAHTVVTAARAAEVAAALAPAPPRPAPPPPPAQERNASVPDASADVMTSTVQMVDAMAASRMDGKAVLLDFGASWCTACRALDKAMHTPRVQAVLAQEYRVVHIDLGNGDPAALALATQYDAMGTFGMPLLIVLNPDGSVRADSARVGQPKYDEAGLAGWLTQWGPR